MLKLNNYFYIIKTISIYVIVMGIIKCEKVFAGIFTFSSLFEIKMKILSFFARIIPITMTYIVLFNFTQLN